MFFGPALFISTTTPTVPIEYFYGFCRFRQRNMAAGYSNNATITLFCIFFSSSRVVQFDSTVSHDDYKNHR